MAMTTVAAERRGNTAVWLIILITIFVIINYADRGAIGIAAPKLTSEVGLDHEQFGLAVSAFAWIYAPAQFFIGWLTSRVCVYRLIAWGLVLWAAATFFTGFVAGLAALVIMRLLLGIGEGVAFPCATKIIAEQVPQHRRGLANGVMAAAFGIGPALGTFAGGLILAAYGWRPIFWAFGALTLLWLIPWAIASKPLKRPVAISRDDAIVPFSKIMRKRGAWTMGIGHFTITYPFYFLLAWLPLYLIENRGFTILEMTKYTTIIYLLFAVGGPAWGWFSDWLSKRFDGGQVRRSLLIIHQLAVGGGVLIGGLTPDKTVLLAALGFAALFFGIGGFASYTIAQIFAGRSSGAWVGVVNGIGNTSGIVGPLLTGWIIKAAGGDYLAAFVLTSAITLFGALWWALAVPKIEPDRELHPA